MGIKKDERLEMSMSSFIRWCSCGRMILRTCQFKDGRCDMCLKEHSQKFHQEFDLKNKDTKEDWQ